MRKHLAKLMISTNHKCHYFLIHPLNVNFHKLFLNILSNKQNRKTLKKNTIQDRN
jgi:hypothetical protein